MWNDLNKNWQEAFKLAWKSFKNNTIPIGAVIVDSNDNIISRGRNRVFDKNSSNILAGTYMAHAEMTAMMELKESEHPKIKTYRLYSTMEPCPMCFGTIVMMGIRSLTYAARDGFAGAAKMNQKIDYIKNKGIKITRGDRELEIFQLIMQTSYEYKRNHIRLEELLNTWREYCREGINFGKKLYEENYFNIAIEKNKDISNIYDEIINRYNYEYGESK